MTDFPQYLQRRQFLWLPFGLFCAPSPFLKVIYFKKFALHGSKFFPFSVASFNEENKTILTVISLEIESIHLSPLQIVLLSGSFLLTT